MHAVKKSGIALALLALACFGACSPSAVAPTRSPEIGAVEDPSPVALATAVPEPPARDSNSLAQRLGPPGQASPSGAALGAGTERALGEQSSFWIMDFGAKRHFLVTATLASISEHAYFYQEVGIGLDRADADEAALVFEEAIRPTVTSAFGSDADGPDGDSRLTVLHARIPGAGGYFSAADCYPPSVMPHSNFRKIVYLNVASIAPGSPAYAAVLAHEFQHVIHFGADPDEETWVNEGLSELATHLCGYEPASGRSFLGRPSTQLTAWSDVAGQLGAHYGAAYLFARFLAEDYGGYSAMRHLAREPEDGIAGIEAYLTHRGYDADFDQLFWRWVRSLEEVVSKESLRSPLQLQDTMPQYSARYLEIELPSQEVALIFTGTVEASLMPLGPYSGSHFWWSQRGDSVDSTLTRELDLSGVDHATLHFWLWWDIERHWDYAYVEISEDGGQTWLALPGQHTTDEDPLDNAYGPGYTGAGGGDPQQWVEETIDLSPYAGKKVQIRFEYVTDEACSQAGIFLDDIAVPELGFSDDAESADVGWQAEGFVRIQNRLPQHYRVAAHLEGQEALEMDIGTARRGQLIIEGPGKALVVIAAWAPQTTEAAPYAIAVLPRPSAE